MTALLRAQHRWHHAAMNNDVMTAFGQYQAAQGLSPKTIKNRAMILGPFARTLSTPLAEASVQDIRAYLARGTIKPGTLRTERAALIAFYTYLHDDGHRDDNPTDRIPPIRVPRSQPRPFTRRQIMQMLTSGVYARTRAMILLGYYQGFRVSQISRVHADDLDGDTITTIAKGNKPARLPLHPVIRELAATMPDTWWFPSPYKDGPIKPESVTDAITNAIKLAGIKDERLTPHSLRHSFGTELVAQGVDIRVIQELMLHEHLSTTQVYTRVSEEHKHESITKLAALPRAA